MEQASPSTSGLYEDGGDGDRGVGGKFRKPPSRRPPMTPHNRPLSNGSQASGRPPNGGWLSKLVDPAYRLISVGATRIFPSILSKSPFFAASTTEDHDNGGSEREEMAYGGNEKCTLNLEISKPEGTDSKEEAEIWNRSSDCDQLGQGKIRNSSDGTEYSKIVRLVKRRRFSRDELNRLTGILNTRVGDLSNVHLEEKKQLMDTRREGKEGVSALENTRMPIEKKQEGLDGARVRNSMPLLPADEGVCASPVDIARAYMRSRVSEIDTASRMIISKEETSFPQSDGFTSSPMPSHSRKSSVCWPGAMVLQDQHDYYSTTPQSNRYGLHHFFQRTPYSRTIYSKSKHDLTHSLADKKRYLNILQSETTLSGKDDALNDANGSVGPIHRVRRKFVSQARPKGPVSLSSVDSQVSVSSVPQSSPNPAVRAISEHLDRNKHATPKEKSAELQLAIGWKKSSSSGVTDSMLEKNTRLPFSFGQGNGREKSNFTVKPPEGSISEAVDVNKDLETCSTLNISQIKCTDEGISTTLKKPPSFHPLGGTKRNLASISVCKQPSSGFTFPVSVSSGVLPEPPTPSIMPYTLTSSLL